LGVEKNNLIEQLLKAEKFEKNEDGFYEESGYGCLEGKVIDFYGTDDNWQIAGLNETDTKKLLEKMNLKEARQEFVNLMKKKLGVEITVKDVNLVGGQADSE
jgi:hypothetical protein